MGGKVCNSAVAGAGVGAGGGSGRVSEIMRPCLGVGTKYLARQEKRKAFWRPRPSCL